MTDEILIREVTLAQALDLAAREGSHGTREASRAAKNDQWADGTFEDAMRLARVGDRTEARHIQAKIDAYRDLRDVTRPVPVWSPVGGSVDMGRFLTGDPNCMVDLTRGKRQSPVVKIAVERAVAWRIDRETIRATGASVLAVVEELRMSGIPAEVWITFTIGTVARHGGRHRTLSTRVLVQQAGRPVNLDLLGFWMVHPAALRRVCFSIWEQEDADLRADFNISPSGGYGFPMTPNEATHRGFDEVAPADRDEVERWIVSVLSRRLGKTPR